MHHHVLCLPWANLSKDKIWHVVAWFSTVRSDCSTKKTIYDKLLHETIVSAIKFVLKIRCTWKCHAQSEIIFMTMTRLNNIIKILEWAFFVPVQFGQNWGFNSKPRSEKKIITGFFSKKVKITLVSECVTLLKHSCCQNIKLVRNIRVRRWEIHSCGNKWSPYGVCLDSAFGNTPPETNHVATFIRHLCFNGKVWLI